MTVNEINDLFFIIMFYSFLLPIILNIIIIATWR